MCTCVFACLFLISQKIYSKTAYKDHNFFKKFFFYFFIFFAKKSENLFKKINKKKIKKYIYISRSSFTKIFLKNKYLFEKSY